MGTKRKPSDVIDYEIPAKFSRIDEVLARGNNALMMLNEIGIKGLKWSIEQINNVFPQRFRAICQFTEPFAGKYEVIKTGQKFIADGCNKGSCRHDIASQIMKLLGSGKNVNDEDCTITSPAHVYPLPLPPTVNDIHRSQSEANILSATATPSTNIEDAVRILNEKIKDLDYKFELREDGYLCCVEFRGYVFKGVGTSKKVAKRNLALQLLKKFFKLNLADEKLIKPMDTAISSSEPQKIPSHRQKNFSNLIQSLVKNGFEKIVASLEMQYSKRKVLAGIVISRQMKDVFPEYCSAVYMNPTGNTGNPFDPNTFDPLQFFSQTGWSVNPDNVAEILKVITLTSGTKCLSGNDLNSDGKVVNDCHAEVVSKRGLQLFLFKTLYRQQNNIQSRLGCDLYGCDILEPAVEGNLWAYRLKPDVRFHLYISSAPCGDSRIFLPQSLNSSAASLIMDESDDEQDEDSHPNRKNRGLLRTKIECGEGTIPIKTKHIQTWDGILGGERLLTMSCSDKVCLWNVLGLQGSLLSNMLTSPVYLDSLIVGSMYHQEHMQRALYERAQPLCQETDWEAPREAETDEGELTIQLEENIDPFKVNTIHILTVADQDERCPGKASNYSFNWILGEDQYEIVHTSKGIRTDNSSSRLCKRNLFKAFLRVFNWLPFVGDCSDGDCSVVTTTTSGVVASSGDQEQVGPLCCVYSQFKNLASVPDDVVGSREYQRKKVSLFSFFERQNYGRWIGKPTEQDWFSVCRRQPTSTNET